MSLRQLKNANLLVKSLRDFTNPFQYEGTDLVNLVTNRVASRDVCTDVGRMSSTGEKLHAEFVEKRLIAQTVNLWDPLPNAKLKLFRTTAKTTTVKMKDGCIVNMKKDQSLFTRTLLVCRSRPYLNLQEIIGRYELTVVPRALFHADGTMLHLAGKSKLMHHLHDLVQKDTVSCSSSVETKTISTALVFDVAVVDAMAEV